MSVRINLLPHREDRRRRQRRHFGILAACAAGVAVAIWGVTHFAIDQMITDQSGRNEFLKRENAKLDKEIQEIKKLKEDIAALLARKQVIETLQSDRSQSVQLLDQLVRQTPDGVYLRSIKQEGGKVSVAGYAQSQARVSTFMRNVQSSPHMENPTLVEIKAAAVSNRRVADFNLHFQMKRPKADEPVAAGKPPAKPPAAAPKQGA